ncbi:C2 domain containing protein [Klebsormidium nitens]|uniref:C2 domain containing protein n=1 Tax=Klebsormidium nitens TaxID=105231 RepID=A0A1Y1IJ09_KLENI|nr:C2 domain containing protein [Klebsormidium nitens]|eukprot:GAQ88647.1 C2 domain containing protein [Klebsormidium nitens]
MGFFVSAFLSLIGYGWGLALGLIAGYLYYLHPTTKAEKPKKPKLQRARTLSPSILKSAMNQIPAWTMYPDWDRTSFLNKAASKLWPYLDTAVRDTVYEMVPPIIEQYRPKQITKIEIEELSLGDFPATLEGAKVFDTVDDEMIVETTLKWASNGRARVGVHAFGLKLTVEASEFWLSVPVRATFRPLVPVFPCFSSIRVTMPNKPRVDFSLKIGGADVMAIPGLLQIVQDQIRQAVAQLFLFPQSMEVYTIEMGSTTQRPTGALYVKLIEGKDLKKTDVFGTSDPFVELWLDGSKRYTSDVKHNTLNPKWNQMFNFLVRDPTNERLTIQLLDRDKVGSKKVAMCQIDFADLEPNELRDYWLDLKKDLEGDANPKNAKFRGKLHLEVEYRPFAGEDLDPVEVGGVVGGTDGTEMIQPDVEIPQGGGLLSITIGQGIDLMPVDRGTCNAYVEFKFRNELHITKDVKKDTNPDWGEHFQILCDSPPRDEFLFIRVWHRNRGKDKLLRAMTNIKHLVKANIEGKKSLGDCMINLSDVVNNRRINDVYQLEHTKKGSIKVELQWLTTGQN